MTREQETILAIIKQYLTDHPNMRFGQALVNLNIVQVTTPEDPMRAEDYVPRVQDPFYNSDVDILKRMKV